MDGDREVLNMEPDFLSSPIPDTDNQALTDSRQMSSAVPQQPLQQRKHRQTHHMSDDEDHDAITIVRVERPVFTRQDFIAKYNYQPSERSGAAFSGVAAAHPGEILPKTVMRHIHQRLKGRRFANTPSGDCFRKAVWSLFPFVNIMRRYNLRNDLLNDIMAGLIVGVMNIPQGTLTGWLKFC
jgi:hypothetical protein